MPSISPGNLFTRFCSQFSRSLACSLYKKAQRGSVSRNSHQFATHVYGKTYIIFLLHIHLPSILANSQRLLATHLSVLLVVSLISECGRGCEEETPRDDGREEREAEEEEGVFVQFGSISRGEAPVESGGEGFGGEDGGHCVDAIADACKYLEFRVHAGHVKLGM